VSPPVIRVLPEELASQIAAGEVVERPASVVKELVENAIDSGATRVQVAVERGGKTLIRVVDDGCGMTAQDVHLALQPHATSKIQSLEDLSRIDSLGFRGEALPSVASVSRLTVTTRPDSAVAGTRCEVSPGAAPRITEVGCGPGTSVEVADLFFNIPARLKFLKTDRTESSHVAETMLLLALAWPGVHFSLTEDGRQSLDLPVHAGLVERASAALARRGAGDLHPVTMSRDGLRVEAALGRASAAVATGRNVYLLVNHRGVRDRLMLRMLASGYGEILERGRYPVAVVHLHLPPDQVDVNVHPQKLEVRFGDEKRVARTLHAAVSEGVSTADWAQVGGVGDPPGRVYRLRAGPGAMDSARSPASASTAGGRSRGYADGASEVRLGYPEAGGGRAPSLVDTGVNEDPAGEDLPPGSLRRCRYLGQIMETYLLFEGDGELVLLDQHAAHERVTYGRLRAALTDGTVRVQRLLFPAQVRLGPAEEEVVREQPDRLAACGFEVELLSGHTCAVRGVPALLADADAEALLLDVAVELAGAHRSETLDQRWDHLAATLACHTSVRGGQILGGQEVAALLRGLDEVERNGHCPHGRPVAMRLSASEIRRRFGRE
jgi:DNA mismatch repair protein MutL